MLSNAMSAAGTYRDELNPPWPKEVMNMKVKLCCDSPAAETISEHSTVHTRMLDKFILAIQPSIKLTTGLRQILESQI